MRCAVPSQRPVDSSDKPLTSYSTPPPKKNPGSISAQFLHSQLLFMQHHVEPRGVDARCLANLVWALAKLDLSSDEGALSSEIASNVAPFVLRCLGGSSPQVGGAGAGRGASDVGRGADSVLLGGLSVVGRSALNPSKITSQLTMNCPPFPHASPKPQGLANMLWSYAKLPVAPPSVIAALVGKIAAELRAQITAPPGADGRPAFDAQALSNSVWALAHLKSRGMDLDAFGDVAVAFLEAVAMAATRMLTRLQQQLLALPRQPGGAPDAAQLLAAAEADFSCQALVNICWALATVAGAACATHPPFVQLFLVVNSESIGRLQATATLLRARQPLPYHGVGGFNEQALSNAVYAFEKARLLTHDLLAAIFDVATLRLRGGGGGHDGHLSFKPQEVCTLLKACHSGVAPPWAFLSALLAVLAQHPAVVDNWSAAEKAELQRAYLLFNQQQAAAQGAAADAALLAQMGALEAQLAQAQQQEAAAAAAAASAHQQWQQLAAQQQQAQAQLSPGNAQHWAAAARLHGGAAARPPPASMPPYGGRPGSGSGQQLPLPRAAPDAFGFAGAGSSSAGASPRTPASQHSAAGATTPTAAAAHFGSPLQQPLAADQGTNKSDRARLAHAPVQHQMALFAQTQQRLAGEGLSTSTAGSLWPASTGVRPGDADGSDQEAASSAAGPASPAGGGGLPLGLGAAAGALDAASLRPWLHAMDAAAALPGY
jgi:hypothetical protein